ncbi:MAG: hypothetical protein L6435_06395 [Anaerolineae bacterium]|nr:hypothetical protein [Anaerolineae bacterium]
MISIKDTHSKYANSGEIVSPVLNEGLLHLAGILTVWEHVAPANHRVVFSE